MGVQMHEQDHDVVVTDLINVYTSATASANAAAELGRDTRLPMMERLRYRQQAQHYQELADQARRMVNELSSRAAA